MILLENDALIAILIIKGREAVFRKACDELCHVVGSEKTRNRNLHSQKAKETDSGANPETRVGRFHKGQTRVAGFAMKCAGIVLQIFPFFTVSLESH